VNATLEIRSSIRGLGLALRRPEELAVRWRDAAERRPLFIPVLIANAVFGTAVYGLTMHMHAGLGPMLRGGFTAPLAAGTAWAVALPALYILGAQLGSRLDFTTTLLAASLTVSFGALALLASVPINWFFTLALPYASVRLLVNLLVFTGVGVAMIDTFIRVMQALEPDRGPEFSYVWLALLGVIGSELFWLLGVFSF
jgi:hypothetical protein